MADYSQYKNLELPKSNEYYDVGVVNKNIMVIDSELHKLDIKNQNQDNLLSTIETKLEDCVTSGKLQTTLQTYLKNEFETNYIDFYQLFNS